MLRHKTRINHYHQTFMRKHLYLTMLLLAGAPALGTFQALANPEPQEQGQAVTTINGTVLDENNEPVIGASVAQKGVARNAVATDAFGHFRIRVSAGTPLEISYVGYQTQTAKASANMTVYLEPTTEVLDQLVVVGYGTQKRANLTGAVATVDVARVMDGRSTTDVAKALQGAVPGLTVTNANGDINGTASIQIRGTGTLSNNATSSPLIIVDGVAVDDLSFVNPEDIADISVLKDASSASIYGTRAAFGVILITTKNPNKEDKVSISYNNNFGWSQAMNLADYPSVYDQIYGLTEANMRSGGELGLFGMNPWEMMPLAQQWAQEHGGKKSGYREMIPWTSDDNIGDYKITPTGAGIYYADWDVKGIMFRTAPSNYHNVTLQGRSGKTQYRLSFGYSGKSDVMAFNPAKMHRYNATGTLSTEIFKWWRAGVRFSFSEKDYTGPYNVRGDYLYMWRWGSYFGPYGYSYDNEGNLVDYRNDIAYRKQAGDYKDVATNTRMTAYMDFDICKGLSLHGDFTYDVTNYRQTTAYMPVYGYDSWGDITAPSYIVPVSWADARQTNSTDDRWSMNVYATYEKSWADAFNLKVMVGSNVEQGDYNYLYAKRDELLDLNLPYLGLTTGGSNQTGYDINQTITHWASAGFFGRINFDYKGIYLLELNGRYDGSSRFSANDQWAFFPSASVGYRFSEENYFKPVKSWWSNAKIRASYGSVGNTAVGDNRFISVIEGPYSGNWLSSTGSLVQYAKMPTLVPGTLTWERVTTGDIGVDLGFFNNTLNASFDWYDRKTSNMLGPSASLPATLGADAPYGNNGTLRTRGWELSLSWNHSFGDWDVYATATLGDARTKIEKWYDSTGTIHSWTPYQSDYNEGTYYGDIWGFETDRYFEASDFENGVLKSSVPSQTALETGSFKYGVGDIKFKDLNGDGVINYGDEGMKDADGNLIPVGSLKNHGDLKVIGNTQPRYEYSLRIGGAWKGFDLDIFFQGVGKRNMWSTSAFVIPLSRGADALYANQMSYNKMTLEQTTKMVEDDKGNMVETITYNITDIAVDQNNKYPTLYPGGGSAVGKVAGLNYGQYNFYPQTRYLLNMAYLRLKAITLGYTLPYDITKKALIQKARVYVSVDNPCLLYNGAKDYPLDPEITAAGTGMGRQSVDKNIYGYGYLGRTTPISRTYSFGIQVTF